MAYNTKPIVTDKDGNPISQYYNPDTDQYEPVEGAGGGNKVVLYNADGTENNSLSLIPILEKLSQLTGTVIDEDTRKSNEIIRQDNEQLRVQLYNDLMAQLDRIEQIQEQVPETVVDSINDIRDKLGDLTLLDTTEKSNLVLALNEIYQDLAAHKAENVQDDDTHGAKSYVNSYGLGAEAKHIADCNELSKTGDTGFYMVDATTINAPYEGFQGTLIHIGRGSRPTQISQEYSSNRMFIRGYRSETDGWNDWTEVISDGNLVQTTEVNDSTKVPSAAVTFALQQLMDSKFQTITGDVLEWALTCDRGITSFYATEPISNVPTLTYSLGFVLKSPGSNVTVFMIDRQNGDMYINPYNTSQSTWFGWKEINMTAV